MRSFPLTITAAVLAALLITISLNGHASAGQPPGVTFAQAVQAYKARQYSRALASFQEVARQVPSDAQTHYYMGLCYQGMNQMSLAKQEYSWVASSSNNAMLRTQSQQALANLGRYQTTRSGSVAAAPPAPGRPGTAPAAGGRPGGQQRLSGKLKVIEFETNWCGVCKRFAPTWEKVAGDFRGRVDFQKLDAEDSANANLVQQYGVRAFPTIIFTDNSGRMLNKEEGAPDEGSLVATINGFLGLR